MEICPFLSKYKTVKEEIKADDGTVIEEREKPVWEPVECKKQDCPIYDTEMGKCLFVNLAEVKKIPKLIDKINQDAGTQTENIKERLEQGFKGLSDKTTVFQENINTEIEKINEFFNKYSEYEKNLENTIFHTGEDISHKIATVSEDMEIKFSSMFENSKTIFHEHLQKIIDNIMLLSEKLDILQDIKTGVEKGFNEVGNNISQTADIIKKSLDTQNNTYEEIRALTSLNQDIKDNLEKYVEEEKEEVKKLTSLNQVIMDNLEKFVAEEKEIKSTLASYLNEIKDERAEIKKLRDAEEAERANDRAVYYYYTGNKELSLKELEKAENLTPDKLEVIINKGMVLSSVGKKDEALETFNRALEIEPKSPEALSGTGLIYFNSGEIEQSIEFFRKALESDKDYAMGYANLGYALKERGDIEEAIKMWKRAVSIDPSLDKVQEDLKIYKERRIDE